MRFKFCYDSHMSQKYVVVHFIDVKNTPTNFHMSQWPLHITLLANFQIIDIDKLQTELVSFTEQRTPFTVAAKGEALFGPQQDVRVSLIEPNSNILGLHADLLKMALDMNALFDAPQYNGPGYRPHSTIHDYARVQDGQSVAVDSLTLVDRFPDNDIKRRRIIQTFDFKHLRA
jgi:2'-5' RNA ligase